MFFFVEQSAVRHAADFIDAVAELKPAVLDMHAARAVRQIAAVDIGDAAGGARCGQP